MKLYFPNFLFILAFLLLKLLSSAAADESNLAIIYKGPGACESCPEAVAKITSLAGLKVRYAGPNEIEAALKLNPALYIQGGGDDAVDISKAMSTQSKQALKDFVKKGGKYLGICAGGYFSGKTVDDDERVPGLNLIPGDADVYKKGDHKAHLEKIIWEGKTEEMYIQDAPKFVLDKNAVYEKVATYSNGDIAALIAPYGNGWVAVSGPHPEATKDWARNDKLPANKLADIKLGVKLIQKLVKKGKAEEFYRGAKGNNLGNLKSIEKLNE